MISVIIPTYNRADRISLSIKSVLNQSYTDFELIVVDDGSNDETENVVSSINDTRIKYFKIKNSGACAARNYGIVHSCGEYVAFHDSDDFWLPNKLEKQMYIMKKFNPDIVFCKLNEINNGSVKRVLPEQLKSGFVRPVFSLFGIGTQTILGKKEVFLTENFDESLPRWQEFELLLRISKRYSLYCIDEGLVNYYIGEDSISRDLKKLFSACELILSKYPQFPKEFPVMSSFISEYLVESTVDKSIDSSDDILEISNRYRPSFFSTLKGKVYKKCYLFANTLELGVKRRFVDKMKGKYPTIQNLNNIEMYFGNDYVNNIVNSILCDELLKNETHVYQDYAKSKIRELFDNFHFEEKQKEQFLSDKIPIWTLWMQGEEKAPDIIKFCFNSHRRFFVSDYFDYHILSSDTIHEYIQIPEIINQKYLEGKITNTHYSDIVRFLLLEKYGGLWIDSSVYVSDYLDEELKNNVLYTNHKLTSKKNNNRLISKGRWTSYFFKMPNNHVLSQFMNQAFLFYWTNYDTLLDYWLVDYVIEYAYEQCDQVRKEVNLVPVNNNDIFKLEQLLCDEFDEHIYNSLLQTNKIHKLTYKVEHPEYTENGKLTFWGYLKRNLR